MLSYVSKIEPKKGVYYTNELYDDYLCKYVVTDRYNDKIIVPGYIYPIIKQLHAIGYIPFVVTPKFDIELDDGTSHIIVWRSATGTLLIMTSKISTVERMCRIC